MGGLPDLAGAKPTPLSIKREKSLRLHGGEAPSMSVSMVGRSQPISAADDLRSDVRTSMSEFEGSVFAVVGRTVCGSYPSLTNPYPNHPLKPTTPAPDCYNDQLVTPDVPATCYRDTYMMYPVQTWASKEMLYGDAQLRQAWVDA